VFYRSYFARLFPTTVRTLHTVVRATTAMYLYLEQGATSLLCIVTDNQPCTDILGTEQLPAKPLNPMGLVIVIIEQYI
jgi:hypothetical protein